MKNKTKIKNGQTWWNDWCFSAIILLQKRVCLPKWNSKAASKAERMQKCREISKNTGKRWLKKEQLSWHIIKRTANYDSRFPNSRHPIFEKLLGHCVTRGGIRGVLHSICDASPWFQYNKESLVAGMEKF